MLSTICCAEHDGGRARDADAAVLVRKLPQLVASLELDDTVIAELVGGRTGRVRRRLR